MKSRLLLVAICCAMAACGPAHTRTEIRESRIVPAAAAQLDPHMRSEQRPSPSVHETAPLTWQAPEGWVQMPSTPIRVANFRVGDPAHAECYISVLPGTAGGIEANIARWRVQMGQTDRLTPDAVADLPRITVLGRQAPLVEVTGRFADSDESGSSDMLLGTVCELEAQTIFVKMVGAEPTVRAQRDAFIAFCASIEMAAQ